MELLCAFFQFPCNMFLPLLTDFEQSIIVFDQPDIKKMQVSQLSTRQADGNVFIVKSKNTPFV